MKIFRVLPNLKECQTLIPVSDDLGIYDYTLNFSGLPKIDEWSSVDFYIDNPLKKSGNFFAFIINSVFAFDEVAKQKLMQYWAIGGEVLPIILENSNDLYLLNVVECANALDIKNTEYEYFKDGTKSNWILKYAFHKSRLKESSIFKIPETANIEILTYSGVKAPEDDFYYAYQKSGLKGLIFEEIYNGE